MFVQTIQGHIADASELKDSLDQWMRDLAPGAHGWLGTTAGVTADGTCVALVRFESPQEARRNSDRPEQHQWWMETSKLFSGEVVFHNCEEIDQFGRGGSDEAGFVQVIQGRVRDVQRMREIGRRMEAEGMNDYRPDVIGGTVALHGDGGYTMALYFTSEQAAREGERKEPPAHLRDIMEEQQSLHEGPPDFLDLADPWLYTHR
jgi:hypothetical protein